MAFSPNTIGGRIAGTTRGAALIGAEKRPDVTRRDRHRMAESSCVRTASSDAETG
jgi:hypothetical protein